MSVYTQSCCLQINVNEQLVQDSLVGLVSLFVDIVYMYSIETSAVVCGYNDIIYLTTVQNSCCAFK